LHFENSQFSDRRINFNPPRKMRNFVFFGLFSAVFAEHFSPFSVKNAVLETKTPVEKAVSLAMGAFFGILGIFGPNFICFWVCGFLIFLCFILFAFFFFFFFFPAKKKIFQPPFSVFFKNFPSKKSKFQIQNLFFYLKTQKKPKDNPSNFHQNHFFFFFSEF
jgi:hypothetical protein